MTTTSLNLALALAGLAMAWVVYSRRRGASEILMAALLATIALGSAMIALQHATDVDPLIDVLERIEYFGGFVLGPLLLLFTRGEVRRRDGWHFAIAAPAALLLLPIELLMLHQFAYTAASARAWSAKRASGRFAGLFIVLFIAIHIAQLVRLGFSDVLWLRNIVPTSVSFALLGIAISGFQTAFPGAVRYARSSRPDDPNGVLRTVRQRIADERLFADCDLSLDTLAQRLHIPPHQLSQLLNESAGQTFRDFITAFRLHDVCRRLSDPANERFTIEALAEESGFGSRSGFYAAFRKRTGMTPVEYRRSIRNMSTPFGMDKPDASLS